MQLNVSPRLNANLLEEKFAQWKADPASVEPTWAAFFEGFELGTTQPVPMNQEAGGASVPAAGGKSAPASEQELSYRARVGTMVYTFRTIGHTGAWIDPLSKEPPHQPLLDLEAFGFSEADLDRPSASQYYKHGKYMPLRTLVNELRSIYCGRVGFEFMHIHNPEVRTWLRQRIEERSPIEAYNADVRKRIFSWLNEAESFEHYLHRKFLGEKRFSLEGGESLLVALHGILEGCEPHAVKEIVMGMAHRGRLNVLANFLKKPLKVLLYEFAENYVPNLVDGDGDVKYHLGYEAKRVLRNGHPVEIRLSANPSHLEAVNAVVEGKARARQRDLGDTQKRSQVLPVLIHGDAAFAGQGTVAEVLNLSQLPGYRTGGTVHIIVNNQIGFTTMPEDARSSDYCTDVAKMIEAPVFHVNADHPAEVFFVSQLAMDFRQQFGRDVVIDMVCYRRHGHNEGDEPEFTQPKIYRAIKHQISAKSLEEKRLVDEEILSKEACAEVSQTFFRRMEDEAKELQALEEKGMGHSFMESTAVIQPPFNFDPVITGIPLNRVKSLGVKLATIPDDFKVNDKIKRRFLAKRQKAAEEGGPFNWANAEALAFAALVTEGTSVRLSGQDSRRGTFSQRHSVLYDTETRERFVPLNHLHPDQASFCVYNSLLSEAAVLGFDYGYSLAGKNMLILWEAQFGDFANGAQVMIDQFICSAESKWQRPSNLVMLLPHGYEGMGPEHSSARLERFLQLCAENNMAVANLTTPAQYFHILRRQTKRAFRKPLILMTPKSLLGHPQCVSASEDFSEDRHFQEIIDDPQYADATTGVNRLIFCSGKVYYDLLDYRKENEIGNAAIIRVEQLYPFHRDRARSIVDRYPNAHKWVWCQEEPLNMGAWSYIQARIQGLRQTHLRYAGRSSASSPAAGAKAIHKKEQKKLVEKAFNL